MTLIKPQLQKNVRLTLVLHIIFSRRTLSCAREVKISRSSMQPQGLNFNNNLRADFVRAKVF